MQKEPGLPAKIATSTRQKDDKSFIYGTTDDEQPDSLTHGKLSTDSMVHGKLSTDSMVHGKFSTDSMVHGKLSTDSVVHGKLSLSIEVGRQITGRWTREVKQTGLWN